MSSVGLIRNVERTDGGYRVLTTSADQTQTPSTYAGCGSFIRRQPLKRLSL